MEGVQDKPKWLAKNGANTIQTFQRIGRAFIILITRMIDQIRPDEPYQTQDEENPWTRFQLKTKRYYSI